MTARGRPRARSRSLGVALGAVLAACSHAKPPPVAAEPESSAVAAELPAGTSATPAAPSAEHAPHAESRPYLASTVIAATIYKLPEVGSRKLGYIRLGGKVRRDPNSVDGRGCKG